MLFKQLTVEKACIASRNLSLQHNGNQANKNAHRINGLPLQIKQLAAQPLQKKWLSWLVITLIVLAHAVGIYWLAASQIIEQPITLPATPMLVSLIAPPAQKPALVPIIKPEMVKPEITPPKPRIKSVVKPQKVVEKINPIETPAQRLVEATTEPVTMQEKSQQEKSQQVTAQPTEVTQIAEVAKSPPKAEKVVEDKIEPPRFGVSYLNNPAPDYPPMSRRLGEEGRVLMKVLVAADGTATHVQIEKSSGSERLDKAAINAVKRWQFLPAKKNNQPLSAYVLVPVKFSLDT